jgi:hypothetical protein
VWRHWADGSRVAIDDREAVEDGPRPFSCDNVESSMWIERSALAIDDGELGAQFRAHDHLLAEKSDITITVPRVRAGRHEDRVAFGSRFDASLDGGLLHRDEDGIGADAAGCEDEQDRSASKPARSCLQNPLVRHCIAVL